MEIFYRVVELCHSGQIAGKEKSRTMAGCLNWLISLIYDQAGKLKSVVAAPDLFKEEGKAPDVCVDPDGNIYALDFDRDMVRIFEPRIDG